MSKLLVFLIVFVSLPATANVVGSDIQNFNPTPNGKGFVTVHSTDTLQPLQFNVGTFLDFTTNSLAYVIGEPDDQHFYSTVHFALGLMQGWDFGVSTSFIHAYEVNQNNFLFSYGDPGINEVRLNTKIRLFKTKRFGLAAVAGADFEQIQGNPFTGNNAGPTANFEAVADLQVTPRLLWAVNLGYRLRQEGTPIPNKGVTPITDQWIYSSALSYRTDSDGSAVIGEIYGSVPLEFISIPSDRQVNNLEGLLGYRWRAIEAFDLHGGLGTKLIHGLGSPDMRIYLGMNIRLGFLSNVTAKKTEPYRNYDPIPQPVQDDQHSDRDADGVPDPIDQCPETLSGSKVDERGCDNGSVPQSLPSKDSDGDTVPDELDRCPGTIPGTKVNGFGCEISDYRG